MKPILNTLIGLTLLLLASAAHGQSELKISFSPATVSGPVGSVVSVDVFADKFNGIVAAQFPIKYNASICRPLNGFPLTCTSSAGEGPGIVLASTPLGLTYTPPNPCATPATNWGGGNVTHKNSGIVGFSWNDPQGNPVSLTPGTKLFTIQFKILATGTSDLVISNPGPPTISVNGPGGSVVVPQFPGPSGPTIQGFAVYPDADEVRPGEIACIPIRVNDFNNILGMQFFMTWDATKFTYRNTQAYNTELKGLDCTQFNYQPSTPNKLVLSWSDGDASTRTLTNGTSIFEVCLTATGASGSTNTFTVSNAALGPTSPVGAFSINGQGQEVNVWTATSGLTSNVGINSAANGLLTATQKYETVHFRVDTVTAQTGATTVDVPVYVQKFRNLNAADFVISFDAAALSYQSFTSSLKFFAPYDTMFQVTAVPGQPGKLRVYWRDWTISDFANNFYNTGGKTLADGAPFMTLRFGIVGAPGTVVPVTVGSLTSPNIPLRVGEQNFSCRFFTPTLQNGSVRLAGSAPVTVTLGSKTDVNCFGGNTGAIDINVGGGTSTQYTYQWNNGLPATQDQNNLSAGSYTVTVSDGTGTTSLTVVIAQPAAPISIPTSGAGALAVQNVKCFGGADGAISYNTAGGTAPYTWNWLHITSGTEPEDLTGLPAGSYQVTVTDSKGCQFTSQQITVTAPTQPFQATATATNVRCFDSSTGGASLSVSGGTGALSYSWRNVSNNNQVSVAQNPNNLPAGQYNVVVTDANGCTTQLPGAITVNNAPGPLAVSDPTTVGIPCSGQNTGSISVPTPTGGWGNYSIQWNPVPGVGGFNPSGVGGGTYTATITDGNGCSVTKTATVSVSSVAPSISSQNVTNITCFNQGNGSITITVNGNWQSIAWSGPNGPAGNGLTISNLGGGTYVPTITYGGGGCTAVGQGITVNNPPAIVASATTTQQTTTTNGSIDLTVSGGVGNFTYAWSNGLAATQDQSSVPAGEYTVTITDGGGCQKVVSVTVTNACLICDATVQATAACEDDGCLNVTVPPGAQSPFILTWSGTESGTIVGTSVCNLKAGPYNLTVTDGTNQTFTFPTQTVGQNPPVAITSTEGNPTLANSNGSIVLTPGPGLALSYQWISGNVPAQFINSPVLFNLDSGYYCVRVKNLLPGGCEKEYCFQLTRQYPEISGSAASNNPTCLSANNGSINLTVDGGDSDFDYAWTGPDGFTATTQDLNNLPQGTYNVTVTDGRGVTKTFGPFTITSQSQLAITNVNETSTNADGFQVSGVGICNGAASVVTSGASGNVTYLWSNGVTTANNTSLCGGPYTVVVTDQFGCTSAWADALTSPTEITTTSSLLVDYNGFGVSCNSTCDGIARVVVNGGVAPYTIKWPSGRVEVVTAAGGASIEDELCGGDHTVTITDKYNVVTNYTITLAEPDAIALTFTDVDPSRLSTCDAEIILEATGAVGDIVVEWRSQFSQGTGPRADELCADEEVTFEVTDANGCKATAKHTAPFPKDGCFILHPVLTPNGDGDNDFVEINCIGSVENTVEVYDRWNQLIQKFTNYQNTWDGKRSGLDLPEGVYFCVFTFTDDQGTVHTKKEYFNLLR